MIICICNNVSERDIHHAVRCGVTTLNGLRDELGVSASCGKCRTCAKTVLNDALGDEQVGTAIFAVATG